MKKILATLAVAITVAASSYGQGTLFLNNTGGSRVSTNSAVGSATASGLTAGNQGAFYYALLYSTSQTTVGGSTAAVYGTGTGTYAFNSAGWVDGMGGVYATNTTAVGRLQGAVLNSDGSFSVNGLAGGTTAQFVIVGWSGNIGSTLAAAEAWYANPTFAGWIGESAVSGPLAVGTLGSTPALTLWGAASPNIPGFTLGLVNVPEPGTLALAALGGASLLLFRRKK